MADSPDSGPSEAHTVDVTYKTTTATSPSPIAAAAATTVTPPWVSQSAVKRTKSILRHSTGRYQSHYHAPPSPANDASSNMHPAADIKHGIGDMDKQQRMAAGAGDDSYAAAAAAPRASVSAARHH